jgi:hypothetical protein
MSIGETQLETWSKVGSQTQSKDTYATVRNALSVNTAPYAGSIDIFLQGSYGNDTNVYGKEGDVDIVAQCDRAFFYDIAGLTPMQQAMYNATPSGPVTYPFAKFREDVIKILKGKFGNDVDTTHKKAIKIKANGNRRGADVLVCQDFRRYRTLTGNPSDYDTGVAFLTADGKRIENFPKAHSAALTAKHQLTSSWLKPTIRIFKNMRNRLIDNRKLQNGVAPSYYVEGMLWNAPTANFGKDYATTVYNCLNWMNTAIESSLTCPNGMSGLIGDNSPTKWPSASYRAFKDGVIDLWNEWK